MTHCFGGYAHTMQVKILCLNHWDVNLKTIRPFVVFNIRKCSELHNVPIVSKNETNVTNTSFLYIHVKYMLNTVTHILLLYPRMVQCLHFANAIGN